MNNFFINGAPSIESFSSKNFFKDNIAEKLSNNFLKMLTEEIKSQDPFNPINSSQMVTQLSQMTQTKTLLDLKKIGTAEILSMLDTQNLASVGLIGKHAGVKTDKLIVKEKGSSISGYLKIDDDSENIDKDIALKITDEKGNKIKEIYTKKDVNGNYTWSWDCRNASGNKVDEGHYNISLSNIKNNNISIVQNTTIKEVVFNEAETSIRLNNGQVIGLNAIDHVSI